MALPVEFLHGISREAINELAVRRYEGDERRKASAMPTGDLTGGDAGMSEKDAAKEDND